MDGNQRKELEDTALNAMMSSKTKPSDKEFLFVCPMIGQVAAANRSIDALIEAEESACLGIICRQIFEILVSLEDVFAKYHLEHERFRDYCNYFAEHGRIGAYNEKKQKWMNAKMSTLCEDYAKYSKNEMVKECYGALCSMTHFSSVHTGEALCREGDTLRVNLSGKRDDANEIYQSANIVRNELTRLIIEIIRREYLNGGSN